MQKWGKTSSGKQRFLCKECHVTSVRSRDDIGRKADQKLFVEWLIGSNHFSDIAKRIRITPRALRKRFQPLWKYQPTPKPITCKPSIAVVDGVSVIKRKQMVLIAQDPSIKKPISWNFTERESYTSWQLFFNDMKKQGVYPDFFVCDGQRGLLKAISEVWPHILIQRCMVHIIRQARAWLTQKPKTRAGYELLVLVKLLSSIETQIQKAVWLLAYAEWLQKHESFLREKTQHPIENKKWWYTHRKLRATRSLISNSLPNLFTYIDYPQVPKTTNHVEGGINSRIKDLLRIHRGLKPRHQQIMIAWFLAAKQDQKPTRKFH